MYEKELLPKALELGLTHAEFWHINPRILSAYIKADIEKKKSEDRMNWYLGQYFLSAIATAFDKKTKYIETPILNDLGLSEQEIADREIRKMIEVEKQWAQNAKNKGLKSLDI